MKKSVLIVLLFGSTRLVMADQALAEMRAANETEPMNSSKTKKTASLEADRTWFFGLSYGVNTSFKRKIKNTRNIVSTVADNEIEQVVSFSAGYQRYFVPQRYGFLLKANYLRFEQDAFDVSYIRLDGNFSYRLSESFVAYLGPNISEYIGGENGDSVVLDPQLGFQVGMNYEFDKRIGFNLTYSEIRDEFEDDSFGTKVIVEDTITSLELGAHYFF
jgi:hypothetical protein